MSFNLPTSSASASTGNFAVSAEHFTYEQLAEIYNQARVDYIVPMPMNAKRMLEYCTYYDVDLKGSFVSFNHDKQETGVGMLGRRDRRGWITRLGVLPHRRGTKVGQFLMENLLNYARHQAVDWVQLEVIKGNEPAHRLFLKLGFEETRELLVVRRPPSKPPASRELTQYLVRELSEDEIPKVLKNRYGKLSWLDESRSLLNAGSLRGYMTLVGDEETWVVFQRTPFQLTHFAFGKFLSASALWTLMHRVHTDYAMQDTKIENLDADAPEWDVLQTFGYVEAFRRVEMYLYYARPES